MNIIHLCLTAPFSDGYSYQENLLTKYHKKMGNNVTVITCQWTLDNDGKLIKTEDNDYVNEDGVRVIRLPIIRGTLTNRLKRYVNFAHVLESIDPDIIFIHDFQCLDLLTVGKYLRKNPNVKAYADNHSDYSNSASSWISKNILHKIVWRYCVGRVKGRIEKFFGVLPARVDFMKELYGLKDSECELLVMGADNELVAKAEDKDSISRIRLKYNITSDDFLIITGGKIDLAKTQTILLMKAIKKINNPHIKLIVFGSVVEELKEQVVSLADGEIIQYIGWVNSSDSYYYFAAADLVIFPGRHSVFWEQVVAQGKPMVVKDWAGTHHIDIGGNVIYLHNDSVDEIEDVINRLIETGSEDFKSIKTSERYVSLKHCAEQGGREQFLYSSIARKSIGME